jgi:chemotaxis protein CheD
MKKLIESHRRNVYLKPGEVIVTRAPLLVSTILGSCVAITFFSPSRGFGAICHAMLPENKRQENDFRYIDTALLHIYGKAVECGAGTDLVVKLFGGARVLDMSDSGQSNPTIGEQNVSKAEELISALGLDLAARDTGGLRGRKLFFCTRSGDVFMRRMHGGRKRIVEEHSL